MGPRGRHPTIYAVATGSCDGPVAIVRVSGSEVGAVARALWGGALPRPRRLVRRRLDLGAAGREDALVVFMAGPNSYTGEDVLELHVHGGAANVGAVLDRLGAIDGLEPAGPGAFTRRAFEAGRIGLSEAEGIAAVIGARTTTALAAARRTAEGVFGRSVETVRDAILRVAAHVEGTLDFPDDVTDGELAGWLDTVRGADERLQGFVRTAAGYRQLCGRPRVVFAGPPNAGKSSLVNAIVGRRRVLVSAEAGTTRDYVEAPAVIEGREVVLVDTAGVRAAAGCAVEAAGIEASAEQIAGADLVVWVEAGDALPAWVPPVVEGGEAPVVWVENKRDLASRRPTWVGASAVAEPGIGALCAAAARALGREALEVPFAVLERHVRRFEDARRALADGLRGAQAGLWEVFAWELRQAVAALDAVLGRGGDGPVGQDVLAEVFGSFCIGK